MEHTKEDSEQDHGCCSSCHLVLKQPYIACSVCKTSSASEPVSICLDCFSKGREFAKHKKNHRYSIVNEEFSVFGDSWTAVEEHKLLEALLQKGEGNWEDIGKSVGTQSSQQCQQHYEKVYLENQDEAFSGIFTGTGKNKINPAIQQPVIFAPLEATSDSVKILRPAQRSSLHKDLAGYNAARGDFDWESDNLAEMELNVIEANDDLYRLIATAASGESDEEDIMEATDDCDNVLVAKLNFVALQVHNQRLKKRLKRKRIVKEFGLLNKARDLGLPRRYPVISNSGSKYEHIFKIGRLLCALDFDFTLEGLEHEMEVRQQILRLQDCRNNGLRFHLAAAFYTKLKSQREQDLVEKPRETILDYVRSAKTKIRHMRANPLMTMTTRRSAGPLDIVGLPCYEKLSEDERDLCSEARVLPEVFLDIQTILVEECKKSNGLRLADARPLVKIDVNKTRKLYDYLLKKELIHAPLQK